MRPAFPFLFPVLLASTTILSCNPRDLPWAQEYSATGSEHLVNAMNRVHAKLAASRFEAARELLDTILYTFPGYTVAGVWKARISLEEQDFETAGYTSEQVLEIDPHNIEALYILALVYEHNGNYAASLSFLDRAAEIRDSAVRLYFDRARIYSRLGLFEEAYEDLSRIESATRNEALLSRTRNLKELLSESGYRQ